MTQRERLLSRLRNWKFDQALDYLDGLDNDARETVQTLARLFNNAGWFGGDMGDLMRFAVDALIEQIEKQDQEPPEPDPGSDNPHCVHEWSEPSEEYDRIYCMLCGADGDA